MPLLDSILERDILPDTVIRSGIRFFLWRKLREESRGGVEEIRQRLMDFIKELRDNPIAIKTCVANEQHYEVPSGFFELVLGPRLKYSCCLWRKGTDSLASAEEDMLDLVCERAQLKDGQKVLELGCGWGSFSLYAAARYPGSHFLAVSNSMTQKEYIDGQARKRRLSNLRVVTSDMNEFEADECFDRVVSIEMFEHMRNYGWLLERIGSWLMPDGLLFVHVFAHRLFAYPFKEEDPSDWIARHFFSGGIMPSADLLLYFQKRLRLKDRWSVSGMHYHKTCEVWLKNMDRQRRLVCGIFKQTYGQQNIRRFLAYWRIFFLACSELFRYGRGKEWRVEHYLFEKN